jgi:hypothetical protein
LSSEASYPPDTAPRVSSHRFLDEGGFFDTADAAERRAKLELSKKDAQTLLASIGEDIGVVPKAPTYGRRSHSRRTRRFKRRSVAKKKFVMKKVPLDKAKLRNDKGREQLLDAICAFSDVCEAAVLFDEVMPQVP